MERRTTGLRFEYDAHLQHREVFLVQLGLSSARGVAAPFAKVGVDDSSRGDLQKRGHEAWFRGS